MMECCKHSGTSECRKIRVNLNARYFFGNLLSLGDVLNITEDCMCINTRMVLPINSVIELLIPSKKDIMSVPVRVCKFDGLESSYSTMSVEILKPSEQYLEFVGSCSPSF
jgi:hypothetical protein